MLHSQRASNDSKLRHCEWQRDTYHTVMHNLVPVFACDNSEQYGNSFAS